MVWRPELIWMNVLSDITLALAYFAIPASAAFFIHRHGKALPYPWIFRMCGIFLVLCGLLHILSIIEIWQPVYYLSGIIKVFTSAIALALAAFSLPLAPVLLNRWSQKLHTDNKG